MNERFNQTQNGFGLKTLLDHAKIFNEGFLKPIVEHRINGNISDEEIFEKGSSMSGTHKNVFIFFYPISEEKPP
jgi:hypothetical protein